MATKRRYTSLGESDFKMIREKDLYFVDKTMLVRSVHESNKILLITRPRRFGKTLSLSMLRYFYSNAADYRPLFEGLAISGDEELMARQGKFPVISISLKSVKPETWEDALYLACKAVAEAFAEHKYLGDSPKFSENYKAMFAALTKRNPDAETCGSALKDLILWLREFHNANVVVLVDEYDTPVTTGWLNGYYREMVDFLKLLLGGALKDNIHVEKSVFTGVLRVSKESFFSDFNSFSAFSVVEQDKFSDKIGFTPEEVRLILSDHGMNGREWDDMVDWYDGYRFGNFTIFNPWSILNYVEHPDYGFRPHWVNTSDNRLLIELFFQASEQIQTNLERLLRGEKIRLAINPHFTYGTLRGSDDAAWNMLLFAGYLKTENTELVGGEIFSDLSIPNREVHYVYRKTITTWIREKLEAQSSFDFMLEYLMKGDIKHFERFFRDFIERVVSFHDTAGPYSENFYHAFLLGLFVRLDGPYIVRSNREAGLGRYDIALIPKEPGQKGFVFELKKPDPVYKETLQMALNKAKKQIKLRKYDQEFADRGISDILCVAIAVEGKEVLVKQV